MVIVYYLKNTVPLQARPANWKIATGGWVERV